MSRKYKLIYGNAKKYSTNNLFFILINARNTYIKRKNGYIL